MKDFFLKNKNAVFITGVVGILALILCAVIVIVSLVTGDGEEGTEPPETEPQFVPSVLDGNEINGVWIASVFNINFPSRADLSADELSAEIDSIVANAKECGLDTIFFQVRPESDALYRSEIFPVSKYMASGRSLTLDALQYMTEKAHSEGIRVHAWVNPVRVTSSKTTTLESLPDKHPAVIHPEYTVAYDDGKIYYNLGIEAVREMICRGIEEIVENYDVDGIVFDDYFYPYPVYVTDENGERKTAEFNDAATYEEYKTSAAEGALSLSDWRRNNVNTLVSEVYETVKKADEECLFGVSPFGIWKNGLGDETGSLTSGMESYHSLFCDSLAWIEGGYVDYISPQIYWTNESPSAPYNAICDWWAERVKGTGVRLIVSHGVYRYEGEWESPSGEITRQLQYAKEKETYRGSVFYGYKALAENVEGLKDELKDFYGK